jgi:glutathione S-transferase
VPVLEYHGETLGQSLAIARFLAKKTGTYGKDELEQCRADAIVDYVNDYNNSMAT